MRSSFFHPIILAGLFTVVVTSEGTAKSTSKTIPHQAEKEAPAETILPAAPVISDQDAAKQRQKELKSQLVDYKKDSSKEPLYQDGKTNWWRQMEVLAAEERKVYMDAFKENSKNYSADEKSGIEKRLIEQSKIYDDWKEKTQLRLDKLREDKNMSAEDMEPLLKDIKKQMYVERTNLYRAYSHIVGSPDKDGGFLSRSSPGSEVAPQVKSTAGDALKLDDKFRDSQMMVDAQLNSLYRRNASALAGFEDVIESNDVKDYAKDMGLESKIRIGGQVEEDLKVFR